MNNKDVAHFRKYLKPDTDLMKVYDIFNVYITKESNDIYHFECHPFAMLDKDQQELFLGNFKKMLSGRFNEKLFELRFQKDAENHTQLILHQGIQAGDAADWQEQMLQLVAKMLKHTQYEHDMVVTFLRGQYFKPTKRSNEDTEQHDRDEVYALNYTLCSLNMVENPKKTLVFDYVNKEFKYHVAVDPVVKLGAPQGGFLYPCFTDGAADVNHVLYCASKVNEPDVRYIEDVLNGEREATASQDKAIFEEIVKEVAGEQLDASTLAQVYEEIHHLIEENEEEEPPLLDYKDVERVLSAGGIEDVTTQQVERAFEQVLDNKHYELKAASVMPKYTSKSIKINTKVATIAIRPQDLKYVKQIDYKGKRCILIEVDEDTVIEGFTMKTEVL